MCNLHVYGNSIKEFENKKTASGCGKSAKGREHKHSYGPVFSSIISPLRSEPVSAARLANYHAFQHVKIIICAKYRFGVCTVT